MQTDKKVNKPLAVVLFVITVLCSGYALSTVYSAVRYAVVLSALLLFPAVYSYLLKNKKMDDITVVLLLSIAMTLMTMFATMGSGIITYILLLCVLITSFGICITYSFDVFIEFFLKVMTVCSVIGIVCHILTVFTPWENLMPRFVNANGAVYRGIGVFFTIEMITERNCGMFWEPGLFATFLIYAIVFEILFKTQPYSKKRLVLYSVALLTTTSSAGYVLLAFCGILWLSSEFHKKNNYRAKVYLLFGLAGMFFLLLLSNVIIANTSLKNNEYINKLLLENIFESSRVMAIGHNIRIFFEHPLLGAGFETALENTQFVSDTSTSTYVMSVFGILGVLYTVWWAIAIFRIKGTSLLTRGILFVIVMCIVNKEPHLFNLFSWIVLFYLLRRQQEPQALLSQPKGDV